MFIRAISTKREVFGYYVCTAELATSEFYCSTTYYLLNGGGAVTAFQTGIARSNYYAQEEMGRKARNFASKE